MNKRLLYIFAFIIGLSSCIRQVIPGEGLKPIVPNPDPKTMDELNVPNGFPYNTSDNLNFNVTLLANNDSPLKGVRVDVMDNSPENGGKILATGITNSLGVLEGNYNIPSYLNEVVINTDYIGVVNNVIIPVSNGKVFAHIGGRNPELHQTVKSKNISKQKFLGKSFNRLSYRLGTFSTGMDGGVPNYFTFPRDVVSGQFLADINNSLPEGMNVMNHHPQYLSPNLDRSLVLTDLCEQVIAILYFSLNIQLIINLQILAKLIH